MTQRKRRRFVSRMICLLLVMAFVISLPALQPMRRDISVYLNTQGYNALWSSQVYEVAANENDAPDAWFSTLHYFFTRNLVHLGELRRIQFSINKAEHDELHRLKGNWNFPGAFVECAATSNDDGTHTFSALISKQDLPNWECFVARHKSGDARIAGE